MTTEERIKDYYERRKLVFCAAFGAAFAKLRFDNMPLFSAKTEALRIAQEAAMALPAPPEEIL